MNDESYEPTEINKSCYRTPSVKRRGPTRRMTRNRWAIDETNITTTTTKTVNLSKRGVIGYILMQRYRGNRDHRRRPPTRSHAIPMASAAAEPVSRDVPSADVGERHEARQPQGEEERLDPSLLKPEARRERGGARLRVGRGPSPSALAQRWFFV